MLLAICGRDKPAWIWEVQPGNELVNLQKYFFHLNNLRSLPSSICEMESLRVLDVHFNELRSLPLTIGKL
jgi:Leucine-rich repeat (LRR) protein